MKGILALSVLLMLAVLPAKAVCRSGTYHVDARIPTLNPNGGSFYGDIPEAAPYRVQLTYPAGGPSTLTDITQLPGNAVSPPTIREIRLNLVFGLGVVDPGLVFKGTSTLVFTLPTSIPNGTTLRLALWSFKSAEGGVTYGSTLSGVSSNYTVKFTIQNLTMPPYGSFGMTLGQ